MGEGDYTEWQDQFESVAAVNGWDDAAKLLWLRVRLTGSMQTTFKRLPEEAKETYALASVALQERFEPASKRELHITEFQVRKKLHGEGWVDFRDALRILANNACPDLEFEARERLSLNRYLEQLPDPQVAFGVKQGQPLTVQDAMTSTLQ